MACLVVSVVEAGAVSLVAVVVGLLEDYGAGGGAEGRGSWMRISEAGFRWRWRGWWRQFRCLVGG